MHIVRSGLRAGVARDPDTIAAAQALRRLVFRGGAAPDVDHLDDLCDHVVLRDDDDPRQGVIGAMRVARGTGYTSREFDVSGLVSSGRCVAEIGRTCLHPDWRGGIGAAVLFEAALDRLRGIGAEIVCGVASFPGADPVRHMPALSALRDRALAPAGIRPVAWGPQAVPIEGGVRASAMRDVPALIKAYLRAGAWVGEGAWVDRHLDTVDVCIVLDLDRMCLPVAARRLRAVG